MNLPKTRQISPKFRGDVAEALSHKVVFIPGGASGLGLLLAELFVRWKAKTIINCGDIAQGMKALERLEKLDGADIGFIPGDIATSGDCHRIVREISELFDRVDLVVNCAGSNPGKQIAYRNGSELQTGNSATANRATCFTEFAASGLFKSRDGAIVDVSPSKGLAGHVLYSANHSARTAVVACPNSWAVVLAPWDIHIHCFCPDQGAMPSYGDLSAEAKQLQQCFAIMKNHYPFSRDANLTELVGFIGVIAVSSTLMFAGNTWPVDGGSTAC